MEKIQTTEMWPMRKVVQVLGISRSTFYVWIKQGLLPVGVRIGPRPVRWPSNEISAVIKARIAGQSDEAVTTLVSRLMDDRQKDEIAKEQPPPQLIEDRTAQITETPTIFFPRRNKK
jgi:prophage regulatory protein